MIKPRNMNDLVVQAYLDTLRHQGFHQIADNMEANYEDQEALKEATRIIKGESNDQDNKKA